MERQSRGEAGRESVSVWCDCLILVSVLTLCFGMVLKHAFFCAKCFCCCYHVSSQFIFCLLSFHDCVCLWFCLSFTMTKQLSSSSLFSYTFSAIAMAAT